MPYAATTGNADKLRFLVGDLSTASANEYLSTKMCTWLLGEYGSVRAAAPHAARAIAARFADAADKSVGDLRLAESQKSEAYITLSRSLERTVAVAAAPYGGGILTEQGTTRAPSFGIGMHDSISNPQSGIGTGSTT